MIDNNLGLTRSSHYQVELDVVAKLLGYSGLLRKVARASSFDYSVAQAAAKWIAECIQGRSKDFSPLDEPVRGLRDAVSLSSGLGITEMWSTISAQRPFCSCSTELKSLEGVACDIDGTHDVYGELVSMLYLLSYIKFVYISRAAHADLPSDGIAYYGWLAYR